LSRRFNRGRIFGADGRCCNSQTTCSGVSGDWLEKKAGVESDMVSSVYRSVFTILLRNLRPARPKDRPPRFYHFGGVFWVVAKAALTVPQRLPMTARAVSSFWITTGTPSNNWASESPRIWRISGSIGGMMSGDAFPMVERNQRAANNIATWRA